MSNNCDICGKVGNFQEFHNEEGFHDDLYVYTSTECTCGNNNASLIICRSCKWDIYHPSFLPSDMQSRLKEEMKYGASELYKYVLCKSCKRDRKINKVLDD